MPPKPPVMFQASATTATISAFIVKPIQTGEDMK